MDTSQPQTVDQILGRYETECLPELAPRTQRDYRRHLRHLSREFGARIAEELRPKDFGPFLQIKRGKVQRVRQLAVLSAAFTQAVSFWYILPSNVLRDVKRPKQHPRDRLILDEEFVAFRATCPLRIKLMMDLALHTGQRQGDLLALRWADLKGMELHFQQSKTGKRLAIGITPELEAVLDRCWLLPNRKLHVVGKEDGDPYTPEGFRSCWQRVARRWRQKHEGFQFRDIRAMAATKCPTVEAARCLLGHSTTAMTWKVYRRGIERSQALSTPLA